MNGKLTHDNSMSKSNIEKNGFFYFLNLVGIII